jgi:hypothetical protein
MPRTPVTRQLLQNLLATARADRMPFVHVAAVVEHHHAILLLDGGDGYAFSPATWQLPTGALLAGHDTLLDVVHRVTTCTEDWTWTRSPATSAATTTKAATPPSAPSPSP